MTEDRYEHIVHPFPPLYDEKSRILILGSLPSVKSREASTNIHIDKVKDGYRIITVGVGDSLGMSLYG